MQQTLEQIGDFIFVEDPLEKADAIFIPGGSHPELGEVAARLYHEGYAPLVVPSGGVSVKTGSFPGSKSKQDLYPGPYVDELSFLTDVLIKNGVPASAILGENQSGTTIENAHFSRRLLDNAGIIIQKGIIVCKSFHARRAKMYYAHAFQEAKLMAHPFPYVDGDHVLTRHTWTHTPAGIKRVLGEMRRVGDQFTQQILNFCETATNKTLDNAPDNAPDKALEPLHIDNPQPNDQPPLCLPPLCLPPLCPPPLGQIHHVELYVSDLKATIDFWGWLLPMLGYSVYQQWEGGISYIHGHTYLVFVQVEARFQQPAYHRCRVGLNHLAFYAPDKETIDRITEALVARGVPLLYSDRHPYAGGPDYYAVFFEDPDRIKVEVAL